MHTYLMDFTYITLDNKASRKVHSLRALVCYRDIQLMQ